MYPGRGARASLTQKENPSRYQRENLRAAQVAGGEAAAEVGQDDHPHRRDVLSMAQVVGGAAIADLQQAHRCLQRLTRPHPAQAVGGEAGVEAHEPPCPTRQKTATKP